MTPTSPTPPTPATPRRTWQPTTSTSPTAGTAASVSALVPAVEAGLITLDEQAIRFRHPLARSGFYRAASLPQRQAAHAALAAVLSGLLDCNTVRKSVRSVAGTGCDDGGMNVRGVDPRDIAYVEDQRVYRVYFSDREPDAPEIYAGATDEYEVSDADLDDVLAWAAGSRRGRAFSVYAYLERGRDRVLRHLVSRDRDGRPASVKVDP